MSDFKPLDIEDAFDEYMRKTLPEVKREATQYKESRQLNAETGETVRLFAKKILHGDSVHREWLTEAAEAFVTGKPLPEPRSLKPKWEDVQEALDDLSAELDLGFIIGKVGERWECGQCGGKGADADSVKHEEGCIHPWWDKLVNTLRQHAKPVSTPPKTPTLPQEKEEVL